MRETVPLALDDMSGTEQKAPDFIGKQCTAEMFGLDDVQIATEVPCAVRLSGANARNSSPQKPAAACAGLNLFRQISHKANEVEDWSLSVESLL